MMDDGEIVQKINNKINQLQDVNYYNSVLILTLEKWNPFLNEFLRTSLPSIIHLLLIHHMLR